ncbi:Na+/H+ antiporter NhaA [Chitinophagaceae bacterium LB-8]|uniref:Na(+)/H(+) antiporter NhaA n=1 Tax=Paraflavisolibacter caeni TaxID=2982496 RepID=A0A9X2XWB9_9BACT|nr:Na+/H+ antiporter NhaA [Paraflavisolibacter caeni]MCU7550260.1 Na+/H+ antiporter NhaA [Paraflavisolibacter caeni]
MKLTKLFRAFFHSEKIGGFILLGCTILSLIIANSPISSTYTQFWHQYVNFSFDGIDLNYSIEHWINDGLMTIFFLLVGLEIERELYVGELHEIKNALLPIAAAVGGMLFPAAIHFLINQGTETQSGFGIPMATDIAFAIGMLAILGSRIPHGLKVFLTALAIIDDLGAIMTIAIFYNTGISWLYLGIALGIFGLLLALNRLKVYKLIFYLVPGVIMWYCMMKSGVHATISGVLLAFAIPFTKDEDSNPSYRIQRFLHKPVSFFILPIFALANTGLILHDGWEQEMLGKNNLGIILGLMIGKPLGIILFSWLMIRTKWSALPYRVTWKHLLGAGMLAGIGFTMSIFISNLAFKDIELIQFSKIAVLTGSFFSCILGLITLYFTPQGAENNNSL